ncbi:hypothetical protein [Deinococcus misasensis]|uniref:hypothetical protein n=1 Tax=Deinococcus misasensis TaxID=392413 RepID=UPI000557E750|nr:hypothetical protein [Deinococcus misasensis]
MNVFQRLLGLGRPKRDPPVTPEARSQLTHLRAQAVRAVSSKLKGGRISRGPTRELGGSFGMGGMRTMAFSGYPNDSAVRLVRLLRWLAQFDPDMSGAIRDFIALANPGHTVRFTGGARAVKQAEQEFKVWAQRIYPVGGGLNGLANNQLREAIFGASSCEWFPLENRKGVQDVAIVPCETVRISQDEEGNYQYFQQAFGPQVQLDTRTYRYIPIQTDSDSPYGVPLMLPAIQATEMHHKAIQSLERVVGLMAKAVLLHAEVPTPTRQELEADSDPDSGPLTDEDYQSAVLDFHTEMASLIIDQAEQGLLITPLGTKLNVTHLAKSAEGYPDVMKALERLKFSGMRTLGFLRGSVDTTTEALAKVQYPMVESEAWNLANVVARQFEFGINLHMQLSGIPVACQVEFQQAPSAFALDEANTESIQVATDLKLYEKFPKAMRSRIEQKHGLDLTEDLADGQPNMPQQPENAVTSMLAFNKLSNAYEEVRQVQ